MSNSKKIDFTVPNKVTSSGHKHHGPNTISVNFGSLFGQLTSDILASLPEYIDKDDIKFFSGKDELTISIFGETWKPDFIMTYKGVVVKIAEAFTTAIKPGKKGTKEKGDFFRYESIDETPKSLSLDVPSVKSAYSDKTVLFDKTDRLIEKDGLIPPVKSLWHSITIDTIDTSRMEEVVRNYTSGHKINDDYLSYCFDGLFHTILTSTRKDDEVNDIQVYGMDYINMINSIFSKILEKITQIDSNPDTKGIPIPIGSKYTTKESKMEVKKLKKVLVKRLEEKGALSRGAVSDLEVRMYEYAIKNFEDFHKFSREQ